MSVPEAAVAPRMQSLIPAWAAVALVTLVTLLHLAVAGRVAFSVDEAHYALYGVHLDWSYFDHPPLVGWMQALVLALSHSEWALRLWPMALAALASLALYRLTARLFPEESRWVPTVAVALLQSAVVFQLVSFAMVPEDPLLCFGLLAALMFARVLDTDRIGDWLVLGLVVGLAGLAKYTAIVLVVSMVAVIAVAHRWSLLRRPGPWLAAAVALLLVTPVVAWNATHEWISFAYQWNHGAPGRDWSAVRFARSLAGQLLAYGGMAVFGAIALFTAWRERRVAGVRFAWLFAAPALLLFLWSAGLEETLPHWTLLGWAFAMPLAARWLVRHWPSRGVRVGVAVALCYAFALVLAIHAQFFRAWIPFTAFEHPLADLYGWREAGERARELAAEREATLMVGNWTYASRIAWYAQRPVQVLDRRVDQFDLWYGTPAPGADAIVIVPERDLRRRDNGLARFARCTESDALTNFLNGQPVHTFYFFDCRQLRNPA